MAIDKVAASLPGITRLDGGLKEIGPKQQREPNSFEKFGDLVSEGIHKVNADVNGFEKISQQFANGEKVNIHEMLLKGEQADMSMRLMLSLKTKVVEAYQEVMRLTV